MNTESHAELLQFLANVLSTHGFNPFEVLDERLRKFLLHLPPSSLLSVIQEFESSVKTSRDSIRNPAGYIMSVSKRITDSISEQIRQLAANEPIMGKNLTPRVLQRVQRLETEGFCRLDEILPECYELMGTMSESEALNAIDELQSSDRSRIKTLFAFFNSILRKYERNPNSSSLGKRAYEPTSALAHSAHSMYGPPPVSVIPPPQPVVSAAFNGMPPAPDHLPLDLFYFDPMKEYAPFMPSPLDDRKLNPFILDKLHHMVQQRLISYQDVDSRVVAELMAITLPSALLALNEFCSADHKTIKNIPGYLYGIIRRIGKPRGSDGPGVEAIPYSQQPRGGPPLAVRGVSCCAFSIEVVT